MDIELEMKLKISPHGLKMILLEYLQNHGYEARENDIEFKIATKCEGYGPMEHDFTYFEVYYLCKTKGDLK